MYVWDRILWGFKRFQPVKEVLLSLRDKAKNDKNSRIQYQKILTHIKALETYGTRIGEPQVKHLDGNL